MRPSFTLPVLVLLCAACAHEREEEVVTPQGPTFTQVKAIVHTHCTASCHAPSQGFPQGMPVILETDADIVQHAAGIKAAIADPVAFNNLRMPPPDTDSLTAAEVNAVVQWWSLGGTTTVCPLN